MILDAADKQMDLILCASVSRFARNVSDCITKVRQLKTMNPSHPVGVYFETENIYTLDPESNHLLSIHAMLAEWESANKSRRMILSYDQRICTGQYPVCDLLGLRHTVDGDLIIQEEEAKTVRFAYLARYTGMPYKHVAAILTEKQRPTLQGRTVWNEDMVRTLLKNERRWGDLSARKTIVIDYAERKTIKNVDERDAAYVTGHHEGIVTPAIAKAVQMVDASRGMDGGVRELGVIEEGGLKGFISVSPSWSAVDNVTFQEICKSVYQEEEYDQLQHIAGIRTGDEHSNMLSLSFTGYEVAPSAYFIGQGTPTLTICRRKIKFNKACLNKLGLNTYMEVLYHPVLQAIVLRTCEEDTINAISVERLIKKNKVPSFPAAAFSAAVYEKMNWLPEYDFRFRGIYRERDGIRAIVFYLDEPQILVGKHLYCTLFSRVPGSGLTVELKPFMSIVRLFTNPAADAGEVTGFFAWFMQGSLPISGIILNILLYLPLGYLLAVLFPTLRNRQILFIGCLCSVFTELVQLGLEMGYCETDDVLYNTLGTAIGVWVWLWQSKRLNVKSANPGKGET